MCVKSKFIHNIKCLQGEKSFQLRLGRIKHCRAHFVCISFEILIKTQNSSLLDPTVPRMWWRWQLSLLASLTLQVFSLLLQKVLVLTAQTWHLFPGVSPCPCLGWAWGASWFHFLSDFQSTLPENRTHVLFAGLFGCNTSKEGFSAEEEISSEDLRMRKSNYHSAIAQHDLFNFQSLPQSWLQVRTMSLVTVLKQLGLSKPVWHLYRLLFCFIEGKYKFSKNLICRTKLLK